MILSPKKCLICGKEFVPKNARGGQKYCSSKCMKEAARIKQHEKYNLQKQSTVTAEALKKHDPYAWLHEFDRLIRKNGGSPHYRN